MHKTVDCTMHYESFGHESPCQVRAGAADQVTRRRRRRRRLPLSLCLSASVHVLLARHQSTNCTAYLGASSGQWPPPLPLFSLSYSSAMRMGRKGGGSTFVPRPPAQVSIAVLRLPSTSSTYTESGTRSVGRFCQKIS